MLFRTLSHVRAEFGRGQSPHLSIRTLWQYLFRLFPALTNQELLPKVLTPQALVALQEAGEQVACSQEASPVSAWLSLSSDLWAMALDFLQKLFVASREAH